MLFTVMVMGIGDDGSPCVSGEVIINSNAIATITDRYRYAYGNDPHTCEISFIAGSPTDIMVLGTKEDILRAANRGEK